MGHWRDGGIGGMPGSDDRPLSEYTLMERLAAISDGLSTDQLAGFIDSWGGSQQVAQDAFDEIERLRDVKTDGLQSQIESLTRQLETDRIALSERQAELESALFKLDLAEREIQRLRTGGKA